MLTEQPLESWCHHDCSSEISTIIDMLTQAQTQQSGNAEKLARTIDLYLESPTLLDPFLKDWILKLSTALLAEIKSGNGSSNRVNVLCECLYSFCKVRGYKWISQFLAVPVMEAKVVLSWANACFTATFPSSVDAGASTLTFSGASTLTFADEPTSTSNEESTPSFVASWHCRYISALWSGAFMLTPFPLKRFFPQDQHQQLYACLKRFILQCQGDPGREGQAAAYYFAMLFRRSDWPHCGELGTFIECNSIASLDCLIQVVKHMDGTALQQHCPALLALAANSALPLKQRLRLGSRLAAVQDTIDLAVYVEGLRAGDASIRWTAAKALVRACPVAAVPGVCAQLLEALGAELSLESRGLDASAAALHGHLLALGRFMHCNRRTRPLPSNSSSLLAATVQGCLRFDQLKGSYSVGSFVRDAACYVAWTWARLEAEPEPSLDLEPLACALACLALFDREVACRRAGAAALQELIGRTARLSRLLPLLEVVHFGSVGPLAAGFSTSIARVLQMLPAWAEPFQEHLLQVTLRNFDGKVRCAAAAALAKCRTRVERLVSEYVDAANNVLYRHGLLLAMAAVIQVASVGACDDGCACACACACNECDGECNCNNNNKKSSNNNNNKNSSNINNNKNSSNINNNKDSSNINNNNIQHLCQIAADANKIPTKSLGFDLLLEAYLKLIAQLPFQDAWISALATALKTRNDALRTAAVDCLDAQATRNPRALCQFFEKCLSGAEGCERDVFSQRGCLAALSAIPVEFEAKGRVVGVLVKAARQTRPIHDIERRCEALRSLKRLLSRAEINLVADDALCLREAFEDGSLLGDYTVDMRGDIGSHVRLEAISVLAAAKLPLTPAVVDGLLEQRYGRIQKLRDAAGALLPRDCLWQDWIGAYRGLIYTAGGLDAQLAIEAASLLKAGNQQILAECLLVGLREHNGRLQMPAVHTIGRLLPDLPGLLVRQAAEYLMDVFVQRQARNIRKLLAAFRLLKRLRAEVGGVREFLEAQAREHEYPAVKQLLLDSDDNNNNNNNNNIE